MGIEFQREKLYEEVWSEPLTKLGKRYGFSDNGLRKICKAMNIPLPKAGHWAKVAAGHTVEKTPLPADAERTTYVANPPEEDAFSETDEDREWREEMSRFEQAPENQITVEPSPRRWHPDLIAIRDRLRGNAKAYLEHQKERARREAARSKGVRATPDVLALKWISYPRDGLLDGHKASPMRVYIGTYERALLIMNTFLFASEKRGYTASYDGKLGRFILDGHGAQVHARITEKTTERIDIAPSDRYSPKDKYPTGELRLCIEKYAYGTSYQIADSDDAPLETKLNSAFLKAYQVSVQLRIQKRRNDAWHASWKAEQRRKAEEAEHRANEERLKKEEQKRRLALVRETRNWKRAERIREYVAHIEGMAPDRHANTLAEWRAWALSVADALDNSASRVAGLQDHAP